MIQNKCSTLGDLKKILINLKKENNPDNLELIKFYENKINIETEKAIQKLEIMDLFEDYENLPTEVLAILENFGSEPCSYKNCENLITELQKIGYSCEYDLSGEPFNLTKL